MVWRENDDEPKKRHCFRRKAELMEKAIFGGNWWEDDNEGSEVRFLWIIAENYFDEVWG